MLKKDEEVVIYDEMRAGEEGEWIVSLSVVTADLPQAERAFAKLSAIALDVSHDSVSQVVSKHMYDTDEDDQSTGEYFDEYTLVKVRKAMLDARVSMVQTDEVINNLQNAGILFRERS